MKRASPLLESPAHRHVARPKTRQEEPSTKKSAPRPLSSLALRRQAEARSRTASGSARKTRSSDGPLRLLHELEVHQIELQLQNAELEAARAENEAALEKVTDLYDFAPVGYFSVDEAGVIHEANLTGATMLGVPRSRLLHQQLQSFVAPAGRPAMIAFLRAVFASAGKQVCEALLLSASGQSFWADLQASSATLPQGTPRWCRLTIADVSALKRGEEAQRRVESLAAANQEANREIARRRAVEASLKESERQQRVLLTEARVLQSQLRSVTRQILVAQEEERKKISRQLHDEIAQVLAGISVQLSALNATASLRPRELRSRISKTRRMVEQSIAVVHRFARDLRPALLDDLGLIPAIRSFAKELALRERLRIHFSAFAEVEALDNFRRTVLYRVAQEALTNVARHARAGNVVVRIQRTDIGVRLDVRDDGRSFSAQQLLSGRHRGRLGLLGMRERVEMVGGQLHIESAPGEGTLVSAEIPWGRDGGSR